MSHEGFSKRHSAQISTNHFITDNDVLNNSKLNFQKKVEDYLTNQKIPNRETNKKSRTIYSTFHAPMSKSRISGGPGETGDNQDVRPRPSLRKSSSVRQVPIEEAREDYSNIAEISPQERESQISLESLFHGRLDTNARKVVEKTVNGIVENWKQADLKCSTSTSSCDSFLKANLCPKMMGKQVECKSVATRNLVLEQGCANSNFTKVITIHNPTTDLYAFKVCCNNFTNCTKYTVTPEAGLLQPQESVPVEIAVNDPQSILRRNAGKETVEIKIFPSLWSTEVSREEIEKCFKEVTTKYPNLVSTQTFEPLIFWSKGILKGKTDFYVPSKDENAVNQHEHSNWTKRFLKSLQKQVYMSNTALRDVLSEIEYFRTSQTVVTFLCIGILGMSVVVYSQQDQLLIKQQEPEDSWLDSLLKGLRLK